MSPWYWVFWAVLTVVNLILFLGARRNLRRTLELLDTRPSRPGTGGAGA